MLIGTKKGMTRVVSRDGAMLPVTVIQVGPCVVVGTRTPERDGYSAVRVGYGGKKPSRLSRPLLGELKKALGEREEYPYTVREFRVSSPEKFQAGQELGVADLLGIEEEARGLTEAEDFKVDVTGITKGRGTAGVMKRWGFGGGPKAHGSKFHRRPGSIGMHSEPAKVIKGTKMAGRYGAERLTITGLSVFGCIPEKNLLLVVGSVPGPTGGLLEIVPSKRKVKNHG